jgi:hypothetical protein
MNNFDPTDEARGWHKYPKPRRRLRRFDHLQGRDRTIALTKVVSWTPSTPVDIHRHRAPRTDIGTTLARAESLGLNIINVRDQYRYRVNNGNCNPTTVDILTNATFRGGDN